MISEEERIWYKSILYPQTFKPDGRGGYERIALLFRTIDEYSKAKQLEAADETQEN
jgi:hypothetical protein